MRIDRALDDRQKGNHFSGKTWNSFPGLNTEPVSDEMRYIEEERLLVREADVS
jgi:hypothetical protein